MSAAVSWISDLVIPWDGQKISKPGLYSGIPMNAYHSDLCVGPSTSSSFIRTVFSESPAHAFEDSYLNPDREPKAISEAFIFGRGAHHLLLGESDFRQHFIIRPEKYPDLKFYPFSESTLEIGGDKPWSSNANWCKGWLFNAEFMGYTVLKAGDIKAIRGMARALARDALVQQGILNGLIEHSFVWLHEETGIWLKWRPDAIPTDSLNFSDLKSSADITRIGIQRALDGFHYHVQGALGALACRAVLGREMADFTLVICEKKPPHIVANRTIKPADITLGLEQIDVTLRLMAKCLKDNDWPGPSGTQADAEYVGISPRAEGIIRDRIAEIEGQLS